MKRKLRLVLLTYDSLYANPVFLPIFQEKYLEIEAIILSDCILHNRSKLGSLWFLLTRHGWKYFTFKAWDQFLYALYGLVRNKPKKLLREAEKKNIPVYKIKDINSRDSLELLKKLKPDIIISYFNQILKKEVLSLPEVECINVHPGYLPLYKGVASSLWARLAGGKFGGVTVHTMVEKLDSGDILARKKVFFQPNESLHMHNYRCCATGGKLLIEVLKNIYEGKKLSVKPGEKTSYFSWPKANDVDKYLQKGYKLFNAGDLELYSA